VIDTVELRGEERRGEERRGEERRGEERSARGVIKRRQYSKSAAVSTRSHCREYGHLLLPLSAPQ
jgi:hypothetical protein